LDSSLGKLATGVAGQAERLAEALTSFTIRIDAIDIPADAISRRLDPLLTAAETSVRRSAAQFGSSIAAESTRVGESLVALGARLDGVEIPADVVVAKVDRLALRIEPSLDRLQIALNDLTAANEGCGRAIGELASETSRVTSEATTITQLIRDLPATVGQLNGALTNLCGDVQDRAAKHIEIAEKAIGDVQRAGADLHRTTREVLDFARRHLDRTS
jgi:hypothetical protein